MKLIIMLLISLLLATGVEAAGSKKKCTKCEKKFKKAEKKFKAEEAKFKKCVTTHHSRTRWQHSLLCLPPPARVRSCAIALVRRYTRTHSAHTSDEAHDLAPHLAPAGNRRGGW